jgi:16S rRNA (guanine1207-N2)-methyltransferase
VGRPNAGAPRREPDHYFSGDPGSSTERRTIRLVLPDLSLDLVTDRGVFSGDRVDPGTKLLLTDVALPDDLAGDVLDLGCGYGPIAVSVARRAPRATVWAIDVNDRALGLTAENAASAGVSDRVRAVAPHAVPDDVSFSAILSNPPIRIGKVALHDLLSTWLRRLAIDARASLVVHKHLGSDSLASWLRSEGFDVQRSGSRMGYRLLSVSR